MPKFRLQRRALAELGALLLVVVSMLSMSCAAKPLPMPSSLPAFDSTTDSATIAKATHIAAIVNSAKRFHHVLNTSDISSVSAFDRTIWTNVTIRPSNFNVNEIATDQRPMNANAFKYYYHHHHYHRTTSTNSQREQFEANILPHSDQTIADKLSATTAISELNLDTMNARQHNIDLNEVQNVPLLRRQRRRRRRRRRLLVHHRRRNTASTEIGRAPSTSNDDADDKFLSTTSSSDYHAIVTSFTSTPTTPVAATAANRKSHHTSSTQSVFLDFLNKNNQNNFYVAENGTHTDDDIIASRSREPDGIKTMSTTSRTLSVRQRSRRTARSLQTSIERAQRKKALRNGSEKTSLERIERSANLSLTKTTKRLQLLIKSRLLQLLPDGTINGTQNDESEYSEYSTSFFFSFRILLSPLRPFRANAFRALSRMPVRQLRDFEPK